MNYNWAWDIFLQPAGDGSGTYLWTLWLGLQWTLLTAISAWCLALALGTLVGIMRTLPSRSARIIGTIHVEVFRNIPLLVQLFIWYFVLPELLPEPASKWLKQLPNSAFWTAVFGIGIFMSVRVAEQLRAGIESLPRGQKSAGMALGLTTAQTYRWILLPVAFRVILPPLTSEFLNTVKNTTVALTIGLVELTARAYAIQEQSFQFFESFTAATVIFLAVNLLITFAMRALERKVAIPGQSTAEAR